MGEIQSVPLIGERIAERQAQGERAVFTNGVFDLLHFGHLSYLGQARALGDLLIVGVNSDESTRRIKGPRRPLVPEDERAGLLAALTCVDYVTIFSDNTAEALLRALTPAIYVKGADYAGSDRRADNYLLAPDELRAVLAGGESRHPELAGLEQRLPEARVVAEYGGSLALLTYLPGHSTTELIERIVSRYAQSEPTGFPESPPGDA
ncbi:MAG: adenylyltransferase/cytidyltransferase family protein [Ktedonobacterales bacterium]